MDQPSLFDHTPPAADQRLVAFRTDLAGWQAAARQQLTAGWPPESLWWTPEPTAPAPADTGRSMKVPRRFIELARPASCHRAADRWALLYAVLWRLAHGERHLLQLAATRRPPGCTGLRQVSTPGFAQDEGVRSLSRCNRARA